MHCELRHVGAFTYRAEFDNGLVEHEHDHVFVGQSAATPVANPAEVDEWRWVTITDLERELSERPDHFTAWLAPALRCLRAAEPGVE